MSTGDRMHHMQIIESFENELSQLRQDIEGLNLIESSLRGKIKQLQDMLGDVVDPPASEIHFVGNLSRRLFHKPECDWALELKFRNIKLFSSREEAVRNGFQTCRVCNP
ncbi:MAG: Ada metal-binding domain-containing protein [Pyrinomonadaceae bacterium]